MKILAHCLHHQNWNRIFRNIQSLSHFVIVHWRFSTSLERKAILSAVSRLLVLVMNVGAWGASTSGAMLTSYERNSKFTSCEVHL